MNLYFVVEGKTEKLIFKKWVKYFHQNLSFVDNITKIKNNNFSIISGGGYPGYFNIVKETFKDINTSNNIDHLFLCFDSEEFSFKDKFEEVKKFIKKECVKINSQIHIIVQNNCIETWLMGNKKISMVGSSNQELLKYRSHYNVNIKDPEGLAKIDHRSIGRFTFRYLKLMLKEKNINYSKTRIGTTGENYYLNELLKRFVKYSHIKSFAYFIDELKNLK